MSATYFEKIGGEGMEYISAPAWGCMASRAVFLGCLPVLARVGPLDCLRSASVSVSGLVIYHNIR